MPNPNLIDGSKMAEAPKKKKWMKKAVKPVEKAETAPQKSKHKSAMHMMHSMYGSKKG